MDRLEVAVVDSLLAVDLLEAVVDSLLVVGAEASLLAEVQADSEVAEADRQRAYSVFLQKGQLQFSLFIFNLLF